MLKFSILVPTRERIEPLKRLLKSIYDTTNHKEQIEVLVACDDDDIPTIEALEALVSQYRSLNLSYFIRPRSEFINHDYYNWLAEKAKGKFIWISADDLIFLQKNWDDIIWRRVNAFLLDKPDRLVCANIFDNTPGPGNPPANKDQFPCFPLFSKEVLQQLGFLLAPQLPTWGADRYAYLLFTKADRFLVINDVVYLDHVSYHTKAMEADAITTRAGELCAKYAVIDKHSFHKQGSIIQQQASQLVRYINEKKMVNA